MQVCTSLQTNNHASTPSLSFLQAGCPSCRPTNSVKALKAYIEGLLFPPEWGRKILRSAYLSARVSQKAHVQLSQNFLSMLLLV